MFRVKDGQRTDEFCLHTRPLIPNADNALTQMLMLQCEIADFKRIANRTRLVRAGA